MTDLAPFITAAHRQSVGHRPDPKHVDFISAFKADPTMVEAARTEYLRLAEIGRARNHGGQDFTGDYEGKVRHAALGRMLEQFDNQKE